MNRYRRKIKRLDHHIVNNQKILVMNGDLLNDKIHSSTFLFSALVGGFAVGYFLGLHLDKTDLKDKLHNMPALLTQTLLKAQTFLPLLSFLKFK